MDGVHDLGGKEGFGPIATTTEDPAFQADWEGRMYALSQTAGPPDMSIDWFRFLVELLPPDAYLTIPYFEKWCMVALTSFVNAGTLTEEEVIAGGGAPSPTLPPAQSVEEVLAAVQAHCTDFSRPDAREPAFAVGAEVMTQSHGVPGHTRLPAYARGRSGHITAYHGAHLFPDAVWQGMEVALPLYTVSFEARELWGPEAAGGDSVMLDLWEPYLLPR